ncbi:MAG: glycosyltransferase [Cyanobacteria bacterium J06633_8]
MTVTMPLISVIVPVYNGEKTIKETIESVLNQTFVNLELIVIDDGSQDSTLNVVYDIKDSRLKVFSYKNAGVAISRNRGIEKASGEFIAFLDADDLWTSDKLEAQLKALESNPQAAVAYSWVDYINAEGEFLHHGNHITINGNAYKQLLVENVLENGSNPLIRRDALIQIDGFNQSLTPAEDWDMWLRLAACYEFVTVPSPQILYRTLSHSGSTNVLKMEKVCLQLIEQAFNDAPASVQCLKKRASGILYYYLIHKSLESKNSSQNYIVTMRFFYNTIRYDASVWQWRIMLKTIIRISTLFVLPPLIYQRFQAVYKRFYAKDSSQLQHNL